MSKNLGRRDGQRRAHAKLAAAMLKRAVPIGLEKKPPLFLGKLNGRHLPQRLRSRQDQSTTQRKRPVTLAPVRAMSKDPEED